MYQVRGYIRGRTLLPFPQPAASIQARLQEEELRLQRLPDERCDLILKTSIESTVIRWGGQVPQTSCDF